MARIRSIKPQLFKNEDLAELPFEARLCFVGLWGQADREGRMEDRPKRLKAEIFPYDSVDMDALLTALATKGFIVRYAVANVSYLAIPTFLKHQRPKTDEHPSVIPPPPDVTSYTDLSAVPRGKDTAPRGKESAPQQSEAAPRIGNRRNGTDIGEEGKEGGWPAPVAAFRSPPEARSKRPIFRGSRFVVFEWQLDDLRRLLGSHADDFDLHAWFFELNEKADAAQIVVPQRDGGKWLQEQTLDEAARRGLPVATTAHTGHGKTAGNVAAAARFVARGQA